MAYMSQEHKARIAALLKPILAPKGFKYSLAVQHHSTIVLTIQSGPMDFFGAYNWANADRKGWNDEPVSPVADDMSINHYHYDRHFEGTGEVLELLEQVIKALNLDNYDKSDSQTDYFNVGHYVELRIGRWDKPYTLTGPAFTPPADEARELKTWPPELPLSDYDDTEVHPCREYGEGDARFTEQCDRDQAQFWSVYLHLKSGGVECVADFATEAEADAYAAKLLNDVDAAEAEASAIARRLADEARADRYVVATTDTTNEDRADWADTAIRAFIKACPTDQEDALPDLLCNLMHWAETKGISFDAMLKRARAVHAEEKREEAELTIH